MADDFAVEMIIRGLAEIKNLCFLKQKFILSEYLTSYFFWIKSSMRIDFIIFDWLIAD